MAYYYQNQIRALQRRIEWMISFHGHLSENWPELALNKIKQLRNEQNIMEKMNDQKRKID